MDFYITAVKEDKLWVDWICWILNNLGYSTKIDIWASKPGSSFLLELYKATNIFSNTIFVLSPEYLEIPYPDTDWTTIFSNLSPHYIKNNIYSFKVKECNPGKLFSDTKFIDLTYLNEKEAIKLIYKVVDNYFRKSKLTNPFLLLNDSKRPKYPNKMPANNVPFSRNKNFVGREIIMKKLKNSLSAKKIIALIESKTENIGIGKTQVALEYIYRYSYNYDIIWWINSTNLFSINNDYLNIAKIIDLGDYENIQNDEAINNIKHWFEESNINWLMIFDNVKNPELLANYIPINSSNGHIIITSRHNDWYKKSSVSCIELEPFNSWETSKFLQKRINQNQNSFYENFSLLLKNLPLALELSCSFIKSSKLSPEDYLEILNNKIFKNTNNAVKPTNINQLIYDNIISLSIRNINNFDPQIIQFLCIISLFEESDIPIYLTKKCIEKINPYFSNIQENDFINSDIIKIPSLYSLITVENGLIHQRYLLKTFFRNKNLRKDIIRIVVETILEIFIEYKKSENNKNLSYIIPHIISLCSEAYLEKIELENIIDILNEAAKFLANIQRFNEAEQTYLKAKFISEAVYGKKNINTAKIINNLAWIYKMTEQYDNSQTLYKKALKIYGKSFGRYNPNTGTLIYNLASLYEKMNNYKEAELLYTKAILIFEKNLGKDNPLRASVINNLAGLYQKTGQFEEAESLYNEALRIRKNFFGIYDINTASTIKNLGYLLLLSKKFREAENTLKQALDIYSNIFGINHKETSEILTGLAELYFESGNYSKAANVCKKSLDIKIKLLGKENNSTKSTSNLLSQIYSFSNIDQNQ